MKRRDSDLIVFEFITDIFHKGKTEEYVLDLVQHAPRVAETDGLEEVRFNNNIYKVYICNHTMQLLDENGVACYTASFRIPISLKEKEVAIKDYTENEGILDALEEAGIVSEPVWYYKSGSMQIPVCMILV